MHAKAGQAGVLIAHFVATGAAATGLTVTGKVWEISDAGAKSPNDTTGTTLTVTEIGGGLYKAPYTMGADGAPIASFATTGTADVKSVPASFVHLGTLDTIVTAVGDVHATDLPALKTVADAAAADALAAHTKVDALHDFDPASDTVARVTLVDTTTTNTDMRGTNGAITSLAGIATATNVADGADEVIAALPAAAPSVTQVSADAARLVAMVENAGGHDRFTAAALETAPTGGSAPTVGDIAAAILVTPAQKIETDASGHVTSTNAGSGATAGEVRTELATELAAILDTETAVDALHDFDPTTQEVTPTAASKTGYSGTATNMVAAAPTAATVAQAVWDVLTSAATTTGSMGKRFMDFVTTLVYAAPPAAAPSAVSIRTEMDSNSTKLANLDAAVSTRLATSGYTTPPTTAQIEAALLNEGDSSALLQAIADKVSGDWSAGDVSATAVASAVRTNLATELARIDAAISTRLAAAGYTAPPAAAPSASDNATAVWGAGTKALTDKAGFSLATAPPTAAAISTAVWGETVRSLTTFGALVADIAAAVWAAATRTLSAFGFTPNAGNMVASAPTTAAIRTELATELARIDVATSTRLATSGYTAPPALTGLATEANATANKNTVVGAMPAAAPSAASVAALILAAPANKLATNSDGSVNADAAVDTSAIAADVVDALEVAGIPTLAVIEGSTVLAKESAATANKAAVIAAIPATITGFATELNATANRNTVVAAIGGGEVTAGTAFTEASEDSAGNVIGITTPGATIRAYAAGDTALITALRRTTAGAQGRWTIYLEPDAGYILAFSRDGYYDAAGGDSVLTVEVSA